jgi:hypothetical protein
MGAGQRAAGLIRLWINFVQPPVDLVLVVVESLVGPRRVAEVVAEPERNLVAGDLSEACDVRWRDAGVKEPADQSGTSPDTGQGQWWPDFASSEIAAATPVQEPRYVDVEDGLWEQNATFIAHARIDVPRLLFEVRPLRKLQPDGGGRAG